MNDSDKVNFEKMVRATATMYPNIKNEDINTMMLKLFFASLRNFTFEQVSYGFEKHLGDSVDGRFFPKPANIIKWLEDKGPATEQKAELAWAQINQELRKHGAYGNLDLDDKQAIAALKSFTTWKEFCMMDVSKMTWAKKEFISMYSTYDKTPLEMLPSSLPGLIELHNHKEKYAKLGAQSAGDIMAKLADKMKGDKND